MSYNEGLVLVSRLPVDVIIGVGVPLAAVAHVRVLTQREKHELERTMKVTRRLFVISFTSSGNLLSTVTCSHLSCQFAGRGTYDRTSPSSSRKSPPNLGVPSYDLMRLGAGDDMTDRSKYDQTKQ